MQHVKEAIERVNHPNLFILHYEDMKQNPEIEIKKLNKFLNTNLNEEQIKNVRFGLFDFKVSF